MHLDIVLRTHYQKNKQPSQTSFRRICGDNKELMILKCFQSLITTINNCSNLKIFLTILDDHSDLEFLEKINKMLSKIKCEYKIVNLNVTGINETCYQQIVYALKAKELVYILEDDYLHEENSLDSLFNAIITLETIYQDYIQNNFIAISPFDCPFRYAKPEPTLLHWDGVRYWRSTNHSTFTLFTYGRVIAEYFNHFKLMSLHMPRIWEGDTINLMYKNIVTNEGKVLLFSPIPSVAYHLSYQEPARILTNHLNWETLWNSINIVE